MIWTQHIYMSLRYLFHFVYIYMSTYSCNKCFNWFWYLLCIKLEIQLTGLNRFGARELKGCCHFGWFASCAINIKSTGNLKTALLFRIHFIFLILGTRLYPKLKWRGEFEGIILWFYFILIFVWIIWWFLEIVFMLFRWIWVVL